MHVRKFIQMFYVWDHPSMIVISCASKGIVTKPWVAVILLRLVLTSVTTAALARLDVQHIRQYSSNAS